MLKYYFILFTLLTLIVAGCSFSDPEPEEVQAQMDQEHARITEEQERQQEEEAEKLLVQEAAATEETAAKEAEAARLAKVENESVLDKIEKLLKPASIEVVQPAGLSLSLSFGHMLDRFELIPDEKTPFLTFKGFFRSRTISSYPNLPKKFQDRNLRPSAQHID